MGRHKAKLHELTLRDKRGRAVCWWAGRDWAFGPWDAAKGEPSPEAAASFRRQVAAWAADPTAGLRADDYLVSTMCRDWVASTDSPPAGTRALGFAKESMAWLCELYGPTPAADFGPVEFRAWQDWLCAQPGPKTGRRMKRATVLRHRSNVVRAVRCAASALRVPASRVAELDTVPVPRAGQVVKDGRRRPVAAAAVKKTLPALPAAVAAAVKLLWWTGARPEELLGLKAGGVVKAGWIETPFDVRLNLDRFNGKVWAAVLLEHKTDDAADRVLFFGPRAQRVLGPLLDATPAGAYLFDPRAAKLAQTAGQAARRGPKSAGSKKAAKGAAAARRPRDHYTAGSFYTAVRRGAKAAGVPHWFPRQLRQSFARRMVRKGQGERVGCCLGHAGVGVTFRYTDRDLVTAAKVYAKWG